MDKLFITILNMSLTGAFVIAAICLARLPLKKAPKIISYCLWAVAGFRLIFPFSIESVFSLIPFKAQPIPLDIAMQPIPRIDSGIPFVNNAVSGILPAATPIDSMNPLQVWTIAGAWVWMIGVAALLIYGVVSFIILKRKMSKAVHVGANTYEAVNIRSPFVLGVFKPRIYLPAGLSGQERGYVILHEQTHIKRRDHIIKFAAYFILCLHWFNPLAWAAFLLMGADMEMSCDERVLKEMGGETKINYSLSLLSLATERRFISGSPLAFGEGGVKERIKNVLNFKKPSRVVIVAAVVLLAVLSVGFAMNRTTAKSENTNNLFIVKDDKKGNTYITDFDSRSLAELAALRTPFVGNHIAVGKILAALPPLDDTHTQRFLSLGTNSEPYSLTAYYEPSGAGMSAETDVRNITDAPRNAALLFALIDNLGKVNFAFRNSPSGGELDETAYKSNIAFSKDDIATYLLENYALSLDSFHNDWNGSVKKLYSPKPMINGEWAGATRNMTLADVRAIAQKIGPDLTYGDLRDFIGKDVGSGLYIMNYDIEGGEYHLMVGSGSTDVNTPVMYAYLGRAGGALDVEKSIDIRYYNVDKYLADGTRELVRPLPIPDPTATALPQPVENLDDAIDIAIVSHNSGKFGVGVSFSTASHVTLKTVEKNNLVTAYILAYYAEYSNDGELHEIAGIHIPVAITFQKPAFGLVEYWEAKDGSYYQSSIHKKFPRDVWDKVDIQLYNEDQKRNCLQKALAYYSSLPPATAENTLYQAYYQVALKLYEMDAGLNSNITLIGLDINSVPENERGLLENRLLMWVNGEANLKPYFATYDELVKMGLIVAEPIDKAGFTNGVLIRFYESSYRDGVLTVKADKYRTPLGAVGAEFTVRFKDGTWTVDEPEMVWMA